MASISKHAGLCQCRKGTLHMQLPCLPSAWQPMPQEPACGALHSGAQPAGHLDLLTFSFPPCIIPTLHASQRKELRGLIVLVSSCAGRVE